MSATGYSILRTIAAGGMGTVYLARRQGAFGFERLVALKRAHSDLERDPAGRRRLVAEAACASRMHHANVVSVIDVIEKNDEVWLVLDWIDGASLARILELSEERDLPSAVALRIVLDACAGLAAAHELVGEDGAPAGLRHRDVSPQNILVGRDGVARLADFGLAKSIDATLTATSDRLLEGKLGYVAPELFAGKRFDERCDLYAMAVVAWEALARRRLFRARTLRELTKEQADPPRLSSVVPGTTAFDDVLRRALDPDPARRYATVRAFVDGLESAAKQAQSLATPLDVARLLAELLEAPVSKGEDGLRTPTTGPMDEPPTWARSADTSIADAPTMTTADVLEDEPTPLAADEVLAPPATPTLSDPPRPSPGRRRRVGATAVAAFAIVCAGAGLAYAVGSRSGTSPASPDPSSAPAGGAEATERAEGPSAPVPAMQETATEPGPVPSAADPLPSAVVDLDVASAGQDEASTRLSTKDSSRSVPAKAAPKTADPVPSVPKNPYRKDPRP